MKQRGDDSGCSATCVSAAKCLQFLRTSAASIRSAWTRLAATSNGPSWRSGDFRRTGHWVGWVWKVSEEIALSPCGFSLHNHSYLTMPPGCKTLVAENKKLTEICCHRCLPCTVQITNACQATSFQLTMRWTSAKMSGMRSLSKHPACSRGSPRSSWGRSRQLFGRILPPTAFKEFMMSRLFNFLRFSK